MRRLRTLLSITAVRLSIVYTLVFGLIAVALVYYMNASTNAILRRQITEAIASETADLERIYSRGGINALMRQLERSAAAPGANLYVVADPAGRIVAGNVLDIDNGVIGTPGWTLGAFDYTRFEDNGEQTYQAVARVIELPNAMRLLVGRDLGEPERFQSIFARALTFSLAAMVLLGIATWILIGRNALRRVDRVAMSTERIMAGDRTERLPVSGAGDEFDRLALRMNAMLDRIERLDEGLRHVSDNIAHDLKTPLTRLRNKADAALAGKSARRGHRQTLAEIIADTDQLIRTFDAILMITRVESGASAARLEPLNLSSLVGDVAELYEPVAEEAGFEVHVAIAPDITVRGNRELLSQALSNLVDNALKYGKPASATAELRVELARSGEFAGIAISDRGPGIPAEDRERVLERFIRLDASRNLSGNGLGLSMVRAVAQLHDGVLEFADSQPGLKAILRIPVESVTGRS